MRKGLFSGISVRRGRTSCAAVLLLVATACTGMQMKPYYEKDFVQSLKAERAGGDALLLGFYVQPESMYYPSGVNYEIKDGTMRVVIDRCAIRTECTTMVRDTRKLAADQPLEVRLPYHGERVVLVHADAEQTIFP